MSQQSYKEKETGHVMSVCSSRVEKKTRFLTQSFFHTRSDTHTNLLFYSSACNEIKFKSVIVLYKKTTVVFIPFIFEWCKYIFYLMSCTLFLSATFSSIQPFFSTKYVRGVPPWRWPAAYVDRKSPGAGSLC